ncbi:hypothetical protein L8106_19798 [Lyngbya sp. PCC 8106]|nr:hypothetical protein L8106_19798 [Lyngbya sp. PCC 8106]
MISKIKGLSSLLTVLNENHLSSGVFDYSSYGN